MRLSPLPVITAVCGFLSTVGHGLVGKTAAWDLYLEMGFTVIEY